MRSGFAHRVELDQKITEENAQRLTTIIFEPTGNRTVTTGAPSADGNVGAWSGRDFLRRQKNRALDAILREVKN